MPFFKRIWMLRRKLLFIPALLMTLFIAYQVSIIMFSHVHFVNGVMLVHSHPSSDNEHTHTEDQILTLAQVSSFVGTAPDCLVIEVSQFPVLYTLKGRGTSGFVSDAYRHCICLRAPPCCI